MKPDSSATVKRTSQRILGTLIGVLLVEAMITSTNNPHLPIAYIMLAALLVPIGLAKNYTLCCAAVTVLVMVMIDLLMLPSRRRSRFIACAFLCHTGGLCSNYYWDSYYLS